MTGLRRRLAGAVLALAATLSGLAATVALPASAAGPTSPAAPVATPSTVATSTPQVTVAVTSITPGVLHPGEDLSVTATVRNDSTATLDGVVADLRLNRFRPASRDELAAWVTGTGGASGSLRSEQ